MTIFELLPWFIAIGVTVLSAALLANRFGLPALWAWLIALAFGIACWAAYWLALKKLGSHLCQRNVKRELEDRTYQPLDVVKDYLVAKNLYYECLVCGNVVPSMPRKNLACKCRNILVDVSPGRIEIRDPAKAKMFSSSPP